jgi:hypothetical protein
MRGRDQGGNPVRRADLGVGKGQGRNCGHDGLARRTARPERQEMDLPYSRCE